MKTQIRELKDLISVGPATLRDFECLGIRSVAKLATKNPQALYDKLNRLSGQPHDICLLDIFHSAVAQARNPRLRPEQCQWWWWSKKREKAAAAKLGRGSSI
jgi:nucleotidyltransferase/DNA polymerase involved in DNA repair